MFLNLETWTQETLQMLHPLFSDETIHVLTYTNLCVVCKAKVYIYTLLT